MRIGRDSTRAGKLLTISAATVYPSAWNNSDPESYMSEAGETEPKTAPPFTPCGRSRRELLWEMGGGFVATALTYLMAQDGFFPAAAQAATPTAGASAGPLAPKKPHFPGKAKNVIFLFMYGGPSQVDTWDPKPELLKYHGQPMPNLEQDPLFKVRNPGKLMASSRKFTRAGQSGIEVSDLYPHLAGCIDDIAVIRSTYADSFAHGSGLLQMNTGAIRQGYPSLGSWVSYGLGTENQNLPAFVVLLDHRGGPISGPPNWGAGFMPATFQGTQFRTSGDPILNLNPPEGVTSAQRRGQIELLRKLHALRGPAGPENSELSARIASYELSFRMQGHAPEAVDLSREPEETKQLYGLDNPITEKFGRRCLLARRLVERGVRFVQVYSGGGHNDENWDAHGDVNKNHELHCAETDRPMYALLTDLKRRGLLDDTLVVWSGEFGRTPTAENGKGRDHNPRGFSTWMAGGGIRGGQVVGATDDFGFAAAENKVHVHDLHATILHLMGLDHERLTFRFQGRDFRLTDVAGHVVHDLIV
ncbi:MAG TPA: DUF1501 domain-containing protein [Armatimonadota bacterium]|nr:DUF1501 domain-containing protein [Armatimonadota bacterium]